MLKLKVVIDAKALAAEVDELLMGWISTDECLDNLTKEQVNTISSLVSQAIRIKIEGEGVQDYVKS